MCVYKYIYIYIHIFIEIDMFNGKHKSLMILPSFLNAIMLILGLHSNRHYSRRPLLVPSWRKSLHRESFHFWSNISHVFLLAEKPMGCTWTRLGGIHSEPQIQIWGEIQRTFAFFLGGGCGRFIWFCYLFEKTCFFFEVLKSFFVV